MSRKTGDRGETIAANWLAARGFEILQRNYRCHWGEVDIIAIRAKALCFIEVKSWKAGAFADVWDAIPMAKRRRLSRACQFFLTQSSVDYDEVSLGALLIAWRQGQAEITFLQDAFECAA